MLSNTLTGCQDDDCQPGNLCDAFLPAGSSEQNGHEAPPVQHRRHQYLDSSKETHDETGTRGTTRDGNRTGKRAYDGGGGSHQSGNAGIGGGRERGRKKEVARETAKGEAKGGSGSDRQARVVKILSGREYTAEDVLALVADAEVADFLRLYRSEGLVKALFKLGALLSREHREEKLRVRRDPRFRGLLARIEEQSQAPAGFSAQSYSKILTALAHLEHVPPPHFLDRLRDGMLGRLRDQVARGPLQPFHLPPPKWPASDLRGDIHSFDPYSLSHIMSAFVNLDCYQPGPEFMALFTEVVANSLMDFQPVGLMSIIRGFAKLGHDPGKPFLKVFTACATRKLHDFPPRALSSTIQGLATMRHQPPPRLLYLPPEPFLRRVVAKAKEKLSAFNPQALCNFIFGLFKLQHDPGVEFMSVYFQACHLKLDQFTPAGFSSMLHSVARLGYYPGISFMEDFEALVAPRLGRFTKGELWKLAHGLATLHYRPQEAFLTAYWEALAGQGRRLTVKDVSLVLWSFAVLDVGAQHAPALLALVETATELIARHRLDPQDDEFASRRGGDDPAVLKYRQLLQAAMYLRTLEAPLLNGAVQRLEDVLEEAWSGRVKARAWAERDADGTIPGAVESEDGGDDGVRGHGGQGGAGERLGGQAQTVSPSSSSSKQSMTFPPRTASLSSSSPPPLFHHTQLDDPTDASGLRDGGGRGPWPPCYLRHFERII
ncbi:hypothetical protein NSK_003265 [Nannochloropsis salina CCMP1776]|uniref:Uncharacterized protein n=1 Tax=Nannochloropsis salina CCMP1776 TaxID=1027361 RepID=A0A4D9D203_9STRA|nr:hypothetical protein NSK_003265 [Nannochloropsis salina CCMP1776]|eukprot:TFJ85761.1 hypothetical protein NSK_003265 [Nannochloropsis salina CCMP1776]